MFLSKLLRELILIRETRLVTLLETLVDCGKQVTDFGDAVTEALTLRDREESEVVGLLTHVEAAVVSVLHERGSEGQLFTAHILH